MKFKVTLLSCIFFCIHFSNSFAATLKSSTTGNWSAPATWGGGAILRTGQWNAISLLTNKVFGTGTKFTTELQVGNKIHASVAILGLREVGVIAEIISDTELRLTANVLVAVSVGSVYSSGVGPSDEVTISSGHTVTLDGSFTCKSLTFEAGNAAATLTHSSTHGLTISNGVILHQPTGNVTSAWNINDGTAVVGGAVSMSGDNTTATRVSSITINNGALHIEGNLSFNGTIPATKVINMSGGTGIIHLKGGLVNASAATLTTGLQSAFNFNGTTAQSVLPFGTGGYCKLKVTNSSSSGVKMEGNIVVGDSLIITNSRLRINGNTLTVQGYVLGEIEGSSSSNLTIENSSAAALLSFNQTADSTRTINNLTLNRSSGNTLLQSEVIVKGALVLSNGLFQLGSSTLNVQGNISYTNGLLSGGSQASLSVTGSGSLSNPIKFATGASTLKNFTINRSNAVVTFGNEMVITGTTNITNGTLSLGNHKITLSGPVYMHATQGRMSSNGASKLEIAGTGTVGDLYFDQSNAGVTNCFGYFAYNRAGTNIPLGNELQIIGVLNPMAGTLVTNNYLTIVSRADASGRIAAGNGNYINGHVKVENYIPAIARRWRFLSSPITNTNVADWQNEIFITGAGEGTTVGTKNSNGFDATQSSRPTLYTYDETVLGNSSSGWMAVTNNTSSLTNVALKSGVGYRVFIRGNRDHLDRLRDLDSTQNAVTLNLNGTINTGDVSLPVTYTNTGSAIDDGWCLLGNPYPSQYDWNSFWDAGNTGNSGSFYQHVSPTVYVYDPVSNSYKSYNALSNIGSLNNGIVAMGQAFFIQTVANNPSITFKETFKTELSAVRLFKNESGIMDVLLYKDSLSFDHFVMKFMDDAQFGYDRYDILKMNGGVNLSSYGADGVFLAGDVRPVKDVDTLFLNVTGANGDYHFTFNALPDDKKYYYLIDTYTSTKKLIQVHDKYAFEINNNELNSFGKSRFMVVMTNEELPTGLKDVVAEHSYSEIKIWPNPATQHVYLSSNHLPIQQVAIYSLDGKRILSQNMVYPNQEVMIETNGLKAGLYLLQTRFTDGSTVMNRFVVK